MLDSDRCWQAVLARDRAGDGRFFFGVLTTGVYCRPSCPARRPRRENVRFYETAKAAGKDGLRPCLRCRPLEPSPVDRMLALLDGSESMTLQDLSRRTGLSPSHLQRTFKAATGVTPKEYLEARRLEAFKSALRGNGKVTDAIYDAGYSSSSRAYEHARHLGMPLSAYRNGGLNVSIEYTTVASPAGPLLVAATGRGLCSVQFGSSGKQLLESLRKEFPAALLEPAGRRVERWADEIARLAPAGLPMDIPATAFQMKVWRCLQSIPRGEVRSYGEVARAIGRPKAVRAVAGACAANPLAVVIPCHRVVRADQTPGGYRWGSERKRKLLAAEYSERYERPR
ncbi:MAG: bifunctional DNA-binding transcriptional regulator/O6-methylguanine-DNA methyltransferase Ada [Acidobacteria bacterium]|nr:bifunctional DNA-binding transcriptional regulator/O6-methylguanine-DNA methyltransferase Ada [Acidobacteriota bacterium]